MIFVAVSVVLWSPASWKHDIDTCSYFLSRRRQVLCIPTLFMPWGFVVRCTVPLCFTVNRLLYRDALFYRDGFVIRADHTKDAVNFLAPNCFRRFIYTLSCKGCIHLFCYVRSEVVPIRRYVPWWLCYSLDGFVVIYCDGVVLCILYSSCIRARRECSSFVDRWNVVPKTCIVVVTAAAQMRCVRYKLCSYVLCRVFA